MGLVDRIVKWGSRTFAGLAFAAASLTASTSAKADFVDTRTQPDIEQKVETAKPKVPSGPFSHEFTINFDSPLNNFDNNTKAWYSANQFIGSACESLGMDRGWDSSAIGRFGVLYLNSWGSIFSEYVSHEIGHDYLTRWNGDSVPFNFDFSKSHGGASSPFYLPKYVQEVVDIKVAFKLFNIQVPENHKKLVFASQAGLYHDELNPAFEFRKRAIKDRIDLGSALTYFFPKTYDLVYLSITPSSVAKGVSEGDLDGDPMVYLSDINSNGINYTKKDYWRYALLCDFLSFSVWESLMGIGDYVANGTRSRPVTKLYSDNVEIVPPNFRLFGIGDGFFVDAEVPLSLYQKDGTVFAYVGTGVDSFGGKGRVNTLRVGAQYDKFRINDILGSGLSADVSPFAYVNLSADNEKRGVSFGADVVLWVNDRTGITARVEYNSNDVIENRIKFKDEGLTGIVGMTVKY